MNPQIATSIRSILIALGGAAVGMGVTDESTMTSIVGGAMVVLPWIWNLWRNRKSGIIAAAAALPEVKTIVTTPSIANSSTFANDPTVVSVNRTMEDGWKR